MNPLVTLNTENGGQFYAIAYFTAFLIGFIVLVIEGKKRNFPSIPWLLIILTSFLFFIIGTQVIRFSLEDWLHVIQFQPINHSVGRSALGGVLCALLSLLCTRYVFKFRFSFMDAFAWAVPIGMFIQRAGCLVAGCCFGAPTNMPWGIQYRAGSHAYFHQVSTHLITDNTPATLSIHPIAIYEMLGCAVILFLIPRLRRTLKVSGNLFLSVISLYLLIRFVTEFFRVGTFSLHFGIANFTLIQVIVFHVIILLLIIITQREINHKSITQYSDQSVSNKVVLLYSLILSLTFLATFRWLNQLEILTASMVLVPSMIFICWKAFKALTVPGLRLTTGCFLVGSLLMMSQTFPERRVKSDTTEYSYHTFKIGAMASSTTTNFTYMNKVTTYGYYEDCSGNSVYGPQTTYNPVKYSAETVTKVMAANYGHVKHNYQGFDSQFGTDIYWGNVTETIKGPSTTVNRSSIFGLRPYFQNDWKLIGFGLGLHVGNIYLFNTPKEVNSASITFKNISAYPSAYFRVGYLNKIFGEVKIANQFPSPFPSLGFQTNVGFGIKGANTGAFRVGTSSYTAVVSSLALPLNNHLNLDLMIGGFPGIVKPRQSEDVQEIRLNKSFVGSLSLQYKIGGKK